MVGAVLGFERHLTMFYWRGDLIDIYLFKCLGLHTILTYIPIGLTPYQLLAANKTAA